MIGGGFIRTGAGRGAGFTTIGVGMTGGGLIRTGAGRGAGFTGPFEITLLPEP
jgi:hypothetical protein